MLFWLLGCAALGGLIGYLLAGVNNRDTTAGAVAGTVIGGAIIAVPAALNDALHSIPQWATPFFAIGVVLLIMGWLADLVLNDLFGRRRR